jgi:hypothetical protein
MGILEKLGNLDGIGYPQSDESAAWRALGGGGNGPWCPACGRVARVRLLHITADQRGSKFVHCWDPRDSFFLSRITYTIELMCGFENCLTRFTVYEERTG